MLKQRHGHIINMSPPIDLTMLSGSLLSLSLSLSPSLPSFHSLSRFYAHAVMQMSALEILKSVITPILGKIGYCISKFGMTLQAHGIGQELKGTGLSHSLSCVPLLTSLSPFLSLYLSSLSHCPPLRCCVQCTVASDSGGVVCDHQLWPRRPVHVAKGEVGEGGRK